MKDKQKTPCPVCHRMFHPNGMGPHVKRMHGISIKGIPVPAILLPAHQEEPPTPCEAEHVEHKEEASQAVPPAQEAREALPQASEPSLQIETASQKPPATDQGEGLRIRLADRSEDISDYLSKAIGEFLSMRIVDPTTDATELFVNAVRKVAPQLPTRIHLTHPIRERIAAEWTSLMDSIEVEIPVVIERTLPAPLPDVQAVLDTVPLSVLFVAVGKRLGETLEKASAIPSSIPVWAVAPPKKEYSPQESVPKPLKVAIIGLLRDQFETVKTTCGHQFDLVHVDKDRANKGLPATADYVIVQRHSPHAWSDAAKRAVGHPNVKYAMGGINSVISQLQNLVGKPCRMESKAV